MQDDWEWAALYMAVMNFDKTDWYRRMELMHTEISRYLEFMEIATSC